MSNANFNPRLEGAAAIFCPLSFFCDISASYARIIAKFSVPSKPSILHILTS